MQPVQMECGESYLDAGGENEEMQGLEQQSSDQKNPIYCSPALQP